MDVKIKKIENGKLPEYKTIGSAGADCYARLKKDIVILKGKSATIPLGFAVEIPEGYEMQIRGRSGLASKLDIEGFTGTIDSDYRGEVNAIIFNHSDKDFIVKPFDRIAQAVISPVIKADWYLVEKLSETERGENGFGSTGVAAAKKVDKFYEPFRTVNEVEKFIGKDVIVDNKTKGKVNAAFISNGFISVQFTLLRDNLYCGDSLRMNLVSAFERVTIDGHRFGKEIEFEWKINKTVYSSRARWVQS